MSREKPSVRVWDLPTRLFHWALAALIALQFATAEFGLLSMEWHYRFGYATLALILFRVVWGFVGSQTSRFADFVRGPRAVARYLRAPMSAQTPSRPGHNPLGGWSIVAMLICVLAQTLSGLFSSDGIDEDGPFADAVSNATIKLATKLHHFGETALLILVTLHVAAVLLHWALKHDNLVAPMITGRKRTDVPVVLKFAGAWRALAVFAGAAVLVWILAAAGS